MYFFDHQEMKLEISDLKNTSTYKRHEDENIHY